MTSAIGPVLVRWARERVREELGGAKAARPDGSVFEAPGATFVTLRWHDGRLQGCIGSLEPTRGLADDVARNAIAAALHDSRSTPIALRDLDQLRVELSILSPLERIAFSDEGSALAALRVGIDGVVLVHHGRRATFLPVMWPRLGKPAAFMAALKTKAGLAPGFWSNELELYRYTTERHEDPS
jgi:AmmeMemoRadiSam system protein A